MKKVVRSQFDMFLAVITVLTIIITDRITKNFFTDLLDLGESLPIIKSVFHFSMVHNTGIAFGLFKDKGAVFIIIPVYISVGGTVPRLTGTFVHADFPRKTS